MVRDKDFQKAVELIDKGGNIVMTSHTRLDGDACGSVAAMAEALAAIGKKVKLIFLSEIPEWYTFLFSEKVPVLGKDVTLEQLTQGQFAGPDLIIIIDTNSNSQLPGFDQYLKQNDKPVLVIDHHETSDSLGDVELVDTTAAATALIVYELLKYAGWKISEKIALALLAGVATDTGWFHFSNTDSRVYRASAELIEAGVNPTEIYHELYQNLSLQRFRLMVRMLNTLELHFDGRFAMQQLVQEDFEQAGAAYKDTENLIDECQRIGSVEVSALFVELGDGRVRCSLRSRCATDVCEIAQKFGGGGHKTAAGAYLSGPVEQAKQLVFDEIAEQFAQNESK
ncbi:MAG: DHH family phosphoesterase [Planctomycetota bacterium]|jgi:phosphoesterase RecJ-like protein